MASLEIGNKTSTISYLNMVRSGIKYRSQDHSDVCEIKQEFGNSPWLTKQSDYYIAISRFCVPLHSVPIIAAMEDAIQVYQFPNVAPFNVGNMPPNAQHNTWINAYFNENPGGTNIEDPVNGNLLATIDLPACDTVYQFQRVIRDKLAAEQINHVNAVGAYSLGDMLRIVLGGLQVDRDDQLY